MTNLNNAIFNIRKLREEKGIGLGKFLEITGLSHFNEHIKKFIIKLVF